VPVPCACAAAATDARQRPKCWPSPPDSKRSR
jgi:hypothetical protein